MQGLNGILAQNSAVPVQRINHLSNLAHWERVISWIRLRA